MPFYFTPRSPMLMTSLPTLEEAGVEYVVSDRHAYLLAANFMEGREGLADFLPWDGLQARNFQRDPDRPEIFDRYQAEALIHQHLPTSAMLGLACYTEAVKSDLDQLAEENGLQLHTAVRPGWYFR